MRDIRKHTAYLRAKAAQFRAMAAAITLPISAEILKLADEMDGYAAELEKRLDAATAI